MLEFTSIMPWIVSRPLRAPLTRRTAAETREAEVARLASQSAYARYSRFRVGAVLIDQAGRRYPGMNIENAAYPLGVCAERLALLRWRAAAGAAIRRVVIFTPTRRTTSPCGLCRHALLHWAGGADLVLVARSEARWIRVCDLLDPDVAGMT